MMPDYSNSTILCYYFKRLFFGFYFIILVIKKDPE